MLNLLNPLLKYVAGGLLFVCIVLGIALKVERAHSAKQAVQIAKLNAELVRITTARDTQKAETSERIKVVTEQVRHADSAARKVEQAILPGQCKSPPEIMGADL